MHAPVAGFPLLPHSAGGMHERAGFCLRKTCGLACRANFCRRRI